MKRETINMIILFSGDFLNAFSNGIFLFPPVQICNESTPSKGSCSFVGDTQRQREPHKISACCSLGFQSVHIKEVSVVACAFIASQWKLTVAKGTNFILLLKEDMKTSLLKLMDHIYRADEGLTKKKKKIQHLVDKALREFTQEGIIFFFLSSFSFTF